MELNVTITIPGRNDRERPVKTMQAALATDLGEDGKGKTLEEQVAFWAERGLENLYKRYHARVEGGAATQANRGTIEANDATNEALRVANKVLKQEKREQAEADWS